MEILCPLRQLAHPDLVAVCRELVRADHPELVALAREVLQRAGVAVERTGVEVAAGADLRIATPAEIAFVSLPAGEFDMGTAEGGYDGERPVHRVRISSPFLLGKYPVTNREYHRFLEANSGIKPPEYWSNSQFNDPQQPVVGGSWDYPAEGCRSAVRYYVRPSSRHDYVGFRVVLVPRSVPPEQSGERSEAGRIESERGTSGD